MQDEQLRYPFEEKFKEDLATYLQEKELVDEILPDTTDMEGKWLGIAEAYLPDGMREFATYPHSVSWLDDVHRYGNCKILGRRLGAI